MHIGFLTPEYPHESTTTAAGIGTSIKNMVNGLAASGVQVSVFVYGQKEDVIFFDGEIKVHLIRQRRYNLMGWYLYRKTIQHYLNNYIRLDKIDAIEAPDWTGITAFMKLNCPLVIRLHGSDAYFCKLENRRQKPKNYLFEKLALLNADHLISVSQFTADETKKIFNLKRKISVIPNSVDVQKFKPQPKEMLPSSILYFGSIIRKKGVLELAEIFNEVVKQNSKAELFIAGRDVIDLQTGRSTKGLMKELFTQGASENVNWLGTLPYEKVVHQVSKSNVVVLPSFAEALPMTWLEAMAMEKALVTSDIGWAKEIMINGKTGYTENPKNISAYAEKILNFIEYPDIAEAMGKNARERVKEKFSTEVVTKRNIEFYEGTIGK